MTQAPAQPDPQVTDPHAGEEDLRMSVGEHLEDLRRRLGLGLAGVGVVLMFTTYWGRDIVGWLTQPMIRALHQSGMPPELTVDHPASAFTLYLKVSMMSALVIGVPWLVYQLWKFVEPGLYRNERGIVYKLTPFSAGMTLVAVLFMYYVLLPVCLTFFVGFALGYPAPKGETPGLFEFLNDAVRWFSPEPTAPAADPSPQPVPLPAPGAQPQVVLVPEVLVLPRYELDPPKPVDGQVWFNTVQRAIKLHVAGTTQVYRPATSTIVRTMITLNSYIDFVLILTLGVVAGFQLPVVMMVLGWAKTIDPQKLADGRRYALLVILVIAAVLTPSDPISMLVLAIPLLGLFEIGLVLMRRAYGDGPVPWFDDAEEDAPVPAAATGAANAAAPAPETASATAPAPADGATPDGASPSEPAPMQEPGSIGGAESDPQPEGERDRK